MKRKKPSRKSLFKKVWKTFSIWVRQSNADWRGYTDCVTCGKRYLWNSGKIHAGHWIHDKLDFDERNVHPQCADCNYYRNKNTNTKYAIYMAKRYGVEGMEELTKLAHKKGNDYTYTELEDLLILYKTKTNLAS